MVLVHITKKSSNRKIGNIPCSITEESSCSPTCPFINSGCYAKTGPVSWHWKKISNGTQSNLTNWGGLCSFVENLKDGQLMRINVAGDLIHKDGVINQDALKQLVKANKNKRAWTYTHHKMNRQNFEAIEQANKNGFTINLSTESLPVADRVIDLNLPAVTVISDKNNYLKPYKGSDNRTYYKVTKQLKTPKGRKIVVCPAQTKESVTCEKCQLCTKQRDFPVAFVAHGNQVKKVNEVLK